MNEQEQSPVNPLWKRWWLWAAFILILIIIALINNRIPQTQQTSTLTKTQNTTLSNTNESLGDLVEHFKSNGFETGEVIGKAYSMMGAVEGFGIMINGEQIEFYRFDIKTTDEETKKNLETARTAGVYSMSGMSFSAIMNGNMMLVRYEDHPEKDKIIEVFKNYKAGE